MEDNYLFDVSIIYVNYKNTNLIIDSYKSLKQFSNGFSYEVIVVDNSEDINVINELKANLDSDVKIIDSGSNLGFGKSNNLGAKEAKGRYLFFLNTDTILLNNAIYELKLFLDNNPNCGACNPNLFQKDLTPNLSFSVNEKNLKNYKKENGFLFFIKKHLFNRKDFFNFTDKPLKINGYLTGAALMMRSEAFNKLEGFDKDIFMYAEETLLCYRLMHELKYEMYNIPQAKIIHLEGGSFKGIKEFHQKSYIDGNYIYLSKAFGKKDADKFLLIMRKAFKRKMIFSKIIHKNYETYRSWYNLYTKKIEDINKKEIM